MQLSPSRATRRGIGVWGPGARLGSTARPRLPIPGTLAQPAAPAHPGVPPSRRRSEAPVAHGGRAEAGAAGGGWASGGAGPGGSAAGRAGGYRLCAGCCGDTPCRGPARPGGGWGTLVPGFASLGSEDRGPADGCAPQLLA
eukprot:gene15573-biopygen677